MSFNTRAKRQKLVRPDAGAELNSLPATEISSKWDKASKMQRCDILASFVERFHASTAADIERFFGSGAQLFFARITATMRLNYKLMAASCDRFCILLLMSAGLFLQGQKFLTSFAEIGGIQLLCDFVASIPNCNHDDNNQGEDNNNHETITNNNNNTKTSSMMIDSPSFVPENTRGSKKSQQQSPNRNNNTSSSQESRATLEAAAKTRAVRLLIHIANSGRVYREMVCEDGGMQHLVNATSFETCDAVLELVGSLFLSLGHGNPRRVRDVHAALLHIARTGNDSAALCAASTLRSLQVARIGPQSQQQQQQQQQQTGSSEHQPSLGLILPENSYNDISNNNKSTSGPTTRTGQHGAARDVADFSDEFLSARSKAAEGSASSSSTASSSGVAAAAAAAGGVSPSELPPHLAGAVVNPIQLVSPSAVTKAQQAAEQEAGLVLYMDSLFHLLRSPSIRVRFEGIELLSLSAGGQGMLAPMLKRCVDILDDVDTTLHAITSLPYEKERAFIHLHASCVRLLFALLTHKDERVALETLRVFEMRLLHLCLGRFMRITQDWHNKSMLTRSLHRTSSNSPTKTGLRTTAAPTAAPGVQDAVRILKVLLTADGLTEQSLAVAHVDRVRRAVESWCRKVLGDSLFAPLLDPNSSLHDPFVIQIADKLTDENRKQLEKENEDEMKREEEEQEEKLRKQEEQMEQRNKK